MRAGQRMHCLFLCAVLLLVYCCSATFAVTVHHRCIHDLVKRYVGAVTDGSPTVLPSVKGALEKAKGAATSAVAEAPQASPSAPKTMEVNSTWDPIRIKFFYVTMKDTAGNLNCSESLQKVTTLFGNQLQCTRDDILTEEKKSLLTTQILPKAVEMHTDRLFVKQLKSRLIVPTFNDTGLCAQFQIPEGHQTTGVEGADMVLYVAAAPIKKATFAWAVACATLGPNGRPVVGVMNFSPRYIANTSQMIRVAAHEMAHTLGFSVGDMEKLNMVQHGVPVRGETTTSLVVSPITRRQAALHYRCDLLEGMELQDGVSFKIQKAAAGAGQTTEQPSASRGVTVASVAQEPPQPSDLKNVILEKEREPPMSLNVTSHWRRRNAKDELMTGLVGAGYYTAITMGAFADMKFYLVDWTKAEPMSWGNNSDCWLLNQTCVRTGQTNYSSMFCTARPEGNVMECTSDRVSLGKCLIEDLQLEIPEQYRYFGDSKKGSSPLTQMDYCPFIGPISGSGCMDGQESVIPGSIIGPNSRCVKGKELKHNNAGIGDVCVQVSCTGNSVSLWYKGGKKWHSCTEGTELQLSGDVLSGKIECPKYSDVCLTLSDPGNTTAPEVVPSEPAAQPEASRGSSAQESQDHTGNSAGTDNSASTTASTAKAQEKEKRNSASGPMSSNAVLAVLALTVLTVIGMTVV